MNTVLAALRVARASYQSELTHLVGEEESVSVYLDRLRQRKAKLEKSIAELTTEIETAEKGEPGA